MKVERLEERENPSFIVAANGNIYFEDMIYTPFSEYTGPLEISLAGDVNDNGSEDIVVGAGEGGGPRVSIFDSSTKDVLANFLAFEDSFRGGVNVAVDTETNTLFVGAGKGGGPVLINYELSTLIERSRYFVGDPSSRTGVELDGQSFIPVLVDPYIIPPITIGSGRYTVYFEFGSTFTGEQAKIIIENSYQHFSPLSDLLTFTTVEPDDFPSNYLTVDLGKDLSFYKEVSAAGLAPASIGIVQKDSFKPNIVYVTEKIAFDFAPVISSHEIGHYFGLDHVEDSSNIMGIGPVIQSTFNNDQFALMRKNIEGVN